MLTVRDLSVSYGRTPAVQELSLDVGEGEIVGLVGPNGAGKSTTLAAIVGLVPAAGGEIAFAGQSLLGLSTERIARCGIALVLEGRSIFAALTVAENLRVGRTASRDRGTFTSAMERVVERFPFLRAKLRAPAGTLSGGEQQQLAIARALMAEPRLLLVDEPSLGLAPRVIDTVFDTLAEIRRDGVTVLLVEQNLTRTLELVDRAYVVRSGRVTLAGDRRELAGLGAFEQAYLGV
jgi:branched-chain amino acid transport system ATP-binding protein